MSAGGWRSTAGREAAASPQSRPRPGGAATQRPADTDIITRVIAGARGGYRAAGFKRRHGSGSACEGQGLHPVHLETPQGLDDQLALRVHPLHRAATTDGERVAAHQ